MAHLYQPDSPLPADAAYRVVPTRCRTSALLAGQEAAWAPAPRIAWGPEHARTTFAALWNEDGLAIRFDVRDVAPWHTMTSHDDPIWEEEVVEVFLDPTGTGRNYLEVEVSPANVVTDLHIREAEPTLVGRLAWDWDGLESSVLPQPGAGLAAQSWVALAWLPWTGLVDLPDDVTMTVPPAPGDRWRFNVFRIKRPFGPAEPEREAVYAAWSAPAGPTFHAPAFFRDLFFVREDRADSQSFLQ
jgi:hypothetical protein